MKMEVIITKIKGNHIPYFWNYQNNFNFNELWSGVLGPIQRRSGKRFKSGVKERG
jgi:hypothetical protein